MFINRKTYDTLVADAHALAASNRELATRVASQEATLQWLMGRVNQVETERAQLFEKYTGVKVGVPQIVQTGPPERAKHDRSFDFPVSFNDVGDMAAAAQGLGWNPDGTLKV